MEYDSQKANREKLVAKAQHSAAAPFFNFVTENWCKVAAARPTLDGKEVHELLWKQWVGRLGRLGGDEAEIAKRGDTGAAIVRREKGVKRMKTMVNLEKLKVEGSRGQSEIKVESLSLFTEKIRSELDRVAPSRDPHEEDVKRAAEEAERAKAEEKAKAAKKLAGEESARKLKLVAEEAGRRMVMRMEEKKQQGEIRRKEEERMNVVARLKEEKAKADQKAKEREEEKRSSEIKQHFNFLPTTPPHAPNFTSPASVDSCSVPEEEGGVVVGSQAEVKRKDEQSEISREEELETSFDSEVKFRTNICCKLCKSHFPIIRYPSPLFFK